MEYLSKFRKWINRDRNGNSNISFIIIGLWMCWLPITEIYKRASIELNGTVVSSGSSCVQPANNRCSTVYAIQGLSGTSEYIAGPTDASLKRWLPVGTRIEKNQWKLAYKINGTIIDDFPIKAYGGMLLLCFMSLSYGIYKTIKKAHLRGSKNAT